MAVTSWSSEGMDWSAPKPEEPAYVEALILAVNERADVVGAQGLPISLAYETRISLDVMRRIADAVYGLAGFFVDPSIDYSKYENAASIGSKTLTVARLRDLTGFAGPDFSSEGLTMKRLGPYAGTLKASLCKMVWVYDLNKRLAGRSFSRSGGRFYELSKSAGSDYYSADYDSWTTDGYREISPESRLPYLVNPWAAAGDAAFENSAFAESQQLWSPLPYACSVGTSSRSSVGGSYITGPVFANRRLSGAREESFTEVRVDSLDTRVTRHPLYLSSEYKIWTVLKTSKSGTSVSKGLNTVSDIATSLDPTVEAFSASRLAPLRAPTVSGGEIEITSEGPGGRDTFGAVSLKSLTLDIHLTVGPSKLKFAFK